MAYQRLALRRILTSAWILAFILSALPPVGPAQAVSPDLVISQVYSAGGNTGATYTHDFIEIFNRGSAPASLAGMSLQYGSATGTGNLGSTATQLTELPSVFVQPGQYYLVYGASGPVGSPLPTPADFEESTPIALAATAGKVALVNSATSLGCNGSSTPCSPAQLALIVDLVGFGTANFFEGAAAAPTLSNTTAALRASGGCTDTDNNGADFTAAAPTPRNTSTPLNACGVIGDAAPTVSSLVPANSAINVALDASLTLTFSEPVALAPAALSLTCTLSAAHALTITDLDDTVFTLDPDAGFQAGDVCTLTVTAASVTDLDADDPPDALAADYTSTFSAVPDTTCGGPATEIAAIQGTTDTSPKLSQTVTVEGVVTGDFQGTAGLNGFFIQDPTPDADPLTSDGVFIYVPSASAFATIPVTPGDHVRLTGEVKEFMGLTEIDFLSALSVCGAVTPLLPAPLSLPETTDGELEAYESVLVSFSETLTVSQNYFQGRYGQLTLSSEGRLFNPTNLFRPGTPAAVAQADENARRLLVLDDGSSAQNPNPIPYIGASGIRRAGDTLPGLTGVLDFGPINSNTALRDYRLHPTVAPVFAEGNPRTLAPQPVGGSLRVSAFNVLNYFTTLGSAGRGASDQVEFDRQRAKIFAALQAVDADVVGLIEIENNGSIAVADLVAGLNTQVGAGTYAYVADPTTGIGDDAIKVALIYKPARVTLVGPSISDMDPVHSRPPVAQTFQSTASGEIFTVVVNHFKSKGSCPADPSDPNADQGDGQGCWNLQRVEQAEALLDFIAGLKTTAADPDVLVVGDLNAYAREDPIHTLTTASSDLLDLIDIYVSDPYSYVFDGAAGYLDHALATASLRAQVTGATQWHINADEPSVIDYNTEFKPQDLYAPTPYRSSDHDPVIVGLNLGETVEIAPTLVSVTPADNATNVALDANLTLTFSEPVALGSGAVGLTCTLSGVHALGASSPDAAVFTLDPVVNLQYGETCTLSVTAAQVTDLDMNDPPDAMLSNFSASFQTAPVPEAAPRVLSVTPPNGFAGQAPDVNITVTFSEPVTLASGAASLSCSFSHVVALTVSSADQVTFTFDPQTGLLPGDLCTFTIAADKVSDVDTQDPFDTLAANFVSTFTVLLETAPSPRLLFVPLVGRGQN